MLVKSINLLKEEKEYAHKRYRSLSEKEKKCLNKKKLLQNIGKHFMVSSICIN